MYVNDFISTIDGKGEDGELVDVPTRRAMNIEIAGRVEAMQRAGWTVIERSEWLDARRYPLVKMAHPKKPDLYYVVYGNGG